METVQIDQHNLRESPVVGGSGGFRGGRKVWALDFGGRAAVVKRDRYGSNDSEVRVWERVKGTRTARLFAEIYAASPNNEYVVMERAAQVLDEAADIDHDKWCGIGTGWQNRTLRAKYTRFVRTLKRECSKLDIECADLHEGNIGLRENGQLCVIDYGHFDVYG